MKKPYEIIIGIDYSLNSTGIAIWNKTLNTFKYFNVTSNAKSTVHKKLNSLINFKYYEIPQVKSDFNQMLRLSLITDLIIGSIEEYLLDKKLYDTEIRIEGFSFNSKGNSFVDLISGQSFLRRDLIDLGYVPYIIPPKTLKKKFTKNGSADKLIMLDEFMTSKTALKKLFSEINSTTVALVSKSGKLVSPVSDIVDAYALTQIEVDDCR